MRNVLKGAKKHIEKKEIEYAQEKHELKNYIIEQRNEIDE